MYNDNVRGKWRTVGTGSAAAVKKDTPPEQRVWIMKTEGIIHELCHAVVFDLDPMRRKKDLDMKISAIFSSMPNHKQDKLEAKALVVQKLVMKKIRLYINWSKLVENTEWQDGERGQRWTDYYLNRSAQLERLAHKVVIWIARVNSETLR